MIRQQPQVGYTLLDSSDSSSVIRFNVRQGITVSAAMAGAASLRGKIAPLTGARFTRQSIVYPSVEPDPGDPVPGLMASRVGVFVFACSAENQYAVAEIFGIRDELIEIGYPCGGMLITLTHPVVAAFVEYMISGIYVNRFGYSLESLAAAFVQIRP